MSVEGFPEVCVVYVQRTSPAGEREVLLGRKKTGLGKGHVVGPGGKVEAGETPRNAAVRELFEEVGLELPPGSLRQIARLTYPFPHRSEWSQVSVVFTAEYQGGAVSESDELAPQWFALSALPLEEMWDDAKYWLPRALTGAYTAATFVFGEDGFTVESSDHPSFGR